MGLDNLLAMPTTLHLGPLAREFKMLRDISRKYCYDKGRLLFLLFGMDYESVAFERKLATKTKTGDEMRRETRERQTTHRADDEKREALKFISSLSVTKTRLGLSRLSTLASLDFRCLTTLSFSPDFFFSG